MNVIVNLLRLCVVTLNGVVFLLLARVLNRIIPCRALAVLDRIGGPVVGIVTGAVSHQLRRRGRTVSRPQEETLALLALWLARALLGVVLTQLI